MRRWAVNEVTGTLSPGDSFRCVFDQGAASGEILRCDPQHELSASWQWDGTDRATRMTVTLTPERRDRALGTHVVWREDDATGDVAAYAAGLHAHLAGLDRAARGLPSTVTRWGADLVIALSELQGRYTAPRIG